MQTKKRFIPCFLLVVAALCFVFAAPSFAAMDKIDEEELSKAHASVTGKPASVVTATNTDKTVERNSTDTATSPSTAAADKKTSSDLLYSLFALRKGNITVTYDNQEIDVTESLERAWSGNTILLIKDLGVFYTDGVRVTTTGSYTVNTRF